MRISSLVLVALALPVFADEKAKPNTLTPKEIADGWILLFDGETTFGWATEGDVQVKDGALVLGGGRLGNAQTRASMFPFTLQVQASADGSAWTDYDATVTPDGAVAARGSLPAEITISRPLDRRIGMSVATGKVAYVRSIKVRPDGMTPLFNGKDLSGWKEFQPTRDKKVASKFTVTKEGWLNVKDGPGDLQTEGQWADFVAQFECISNGKHLNSGLFFRCIPDQYQNGYEAQIRNQWEGDDRTKPVDFGTGAIYRRQKARKVVSTDGEWFTMTVAAHSRHIATWVNGYQVTDWTDDRKEDENARNGFKKGKGALSIQGHDPTTDLSFRNIRIQSLDPR
jgi:3-keto-disaccharide hydrolase